MNTRPSGVELEPVLCPACLSEGRAQRTWFDYETLTYNCAIHGPAITVQTVG